MKYACSTYYTTSKPVEQGNNVSYCANYKMRNVYNVKVHTHDSLAAPAKPRKVEIKIVQFIEATSQK